MANVLVEPGRPSGKQPSPPSTSSTVVCSEAPGCLSYYCLTAGEANFFFLDVEDGAMHRLACGVHKESLELHKPGTLSSVGWKVVRVQVVVPCALW